MENWLTYEDAAARLGIKVASVKRQARSKKWARRSMNDGTVQVLIPPDRLADRPSDNRAAQPPADPPPDYTARLAAAEVRAELAERRANEIASERDEWKQMAQRLSEPRPSIIDRIFRR